MYIKDHKLRGECHKELGVQEQEDQIVDAFQPNAAQKSAVRFLYIFERDSKYIYEFDLQTRILQKRTALTTTSFPHNFQSVQTPRGKLFLIGGGDFQ